MSTTSRPGAELQLATCLVLSEFDIDKGACVRSHYPKQKNFKVFFLNKDEGVMQTKVATIDMVKEEEYFANVMLPDGAEKVEIAKSMFVCARPRPPVFARFPCYRFSPTSRQSPPYTDASWSRLLAEAKSPLTSEILLINRKNGHVSIRYKDQVLLSPSRLLIDDIYVLPTLPAEVDAIARELSTQFPSHSANGVLPLFMFFVLNMGEGNVLGVLMQSTLFQNFVEALSSALEPAVVPKKEVAPPPPAATEDTAEASAPVEPPTKDAPSTEAPGMATPDENGGDPVPVEVEEQDVPAEVAVPSNPIEEEKLETSVEPDGHISEKDEGESQPDDTHDSHEHIIQVTDHADGSTMEHDELSHPLDVPGGGLSSNMDSSHVRSTVTSEYPAGSSAGNIQLPASSSQHSKTGSNDLSHPLSPEPEEQEEEEVYDAEEGGDEACAPLYGLAAVVTKRDSLAKRGGLTKSVAVLGPYVSWLEPFFSTLVEAAYYCCDIPGTDSDAEKQQENVLKTCFEMINKASALVASSMKKITPLESEVQRFCTLTGSPHLYVVHRDSPFGSFQKMRIPTFPSLSDIMFVNFGLENLIEILGPSFMHLVEGVFTEKKIVILSRLGQATDVCEAALSLGMVGSILDPHFMAKKVFPYTSVNIADHFVGVPGYIIGTMNPIFLNSKTWKWDLLCNLDEKTVVFADEKKSSKRPGASLYAALTTNFSNATAGLRTSDTGKAAHDSANEEMDVYKELVSLIYRFRALRIPTGERNKRIWLFLEERIHTLLLVDHAKSGDASILDILQHSFCTPSATQLRLRVQATSLVDNVSTHVLQKNEPTALPLLCAALRRCSSGEDIFSVQRVLQAMLKFLDGKESILMLLRRMPIAVGGIDPIAFQLTHPSPTIRAVALQLLKTIETIPEGKSAISAMSNFLITVYDKQSSEAQ
ncbi:Stabilization of polarity axis, putative [Angomonas deanei]|uniref:Stabilization of polarity axis, putative n=1 Tax=Angomonas deanei TaxID=59799 RepID=A0A7G2CDU0_9TRYP|nr:Stabilization of polarity axis, putative [Angomonas deanei]